MPPIRLPFLDRPVSDWIAQLQNATVPDDRLQALQAIRMTGSQTEVVESSIRGLHDADSTVRAFAAKLIGTSPMSISAETESRLISMLSDSDPDVRFESSRALIAKKSRATNGTLTVLLHFLDEVETNPLMIAAVVNTLVGMELDLKTAIDVLQPRVVQQLENERGEVREAIATAFARWPSMAVTCLDRLLPLLDDSEPVVRENIARALGLAGVSTDQVRSALQVARDDEDVEVAAAAKEALHRLEGPNFNSL